MTRMTTRMRTVMTMNTIMSMGTGEGAATITTMGTRPYGRLVLPAQ
ncbi:MAG: hypothetical protein SPK00_07075 [Corynebacterium glucuronolyticum]|nr:hypothetical protein [Mycobacteriaceae bacterium]MDY5834492.1 hypothetical protein [Corynebacterium glucuronolyticum]